MVNFYLFLDRLPNKYSIKLIDCFVICVLGLTQSLFKQTVEAQLRATQPPVASINFAADPSPVCLPSRAFIFFHPRPLLSEEKGRKDGSEGKRRREGEGDEEAIGLSPGAKKITYTSTTPICTTKMRYTIT